MLSDPVVAEDVDTLYRVLLGRPPEDGIVDRIVASRRSTADLLASFLVSPEYARRAVSAVDNAYFHSIEENEVRLESSRSDMEAFEAHIRRVWSDFGRQTPYWSVLTLDDYRDGLTAETERQFYDTGALEFRTFLAMCRRNSVLVPRDGVVLDFGCGVGRLGEQLSAEFARYIGVDISAPHLEITRRHLEKLGRTNVSLQLAPDFLDATDGFDCFFSLIVLQHNPPPIIARIINTALERLRPGGLAYFQVPTFIHGYRFNVEDYLALLKGKGGDMEMHAFPQSQVHRLIARHRCRLVEMIPDGMDAGMGRSHTFLIQKPI